MGLGEGSPPVLKSSVILPLVVSGLFVAIYVGSEFAFLGVSGEYTGEISSIPIIDVQAASAATEVRKACRETGFFYITNHGVDEDVIARVFERTRELFDLPLEEKERIMDSDLNRGYTRIREEIQDPTVQKEGDFKEGFYIGLEVSADSQLSKDFPLYGPNIWPNETAGILPGFRNDMDIYFEEMIALGTRISELLAESLGLPRKYFEPDFTAPMAVLRLLRYLPVVSKISEGKLGAGAHSDYGLLTILTMDTPGLEVETTNGDWIRIDPVPGTFVVNLGDMLARWTNDMYRSTRHRVIMKEPTVRYSIPFFFEPNYDTKVECVPSICGAGNGQLGLFGSPQVPKYPPTQSGAYLLSKLYQTHADFARSGAADTVKEEL